MRGSGDRGGSFGLGLAIVQAIARSHGGSVALEHSKAQTGARFVVRLPGAAQTSTTTGRTMGRRFRRS